METSSLPYYLEKPDKHDKHHENLLTVYIQYKCQCEMRKPLGQNTSWESKEQMEDNIKTSLKKT